MRRKTLYLFLFVSLTKSLSAQVVRNQNADFTIHPGHTPSQPNHWTFVWQNNDCYAFDLPPQITGDVPGWTISHGHPLPDDVSDGRCMGLEYSLEDGCGHGVAAMYHFIAGKTYTITVGFCPDLGSSFTDITNGIFRITAMPTHPNGRKFLYCCDVIPHVSGEQVVGTITPTNFNHYFNKFDFIASQDFYYLMVYPQQLIAGNKTKTNVDYVNVYRWCEPSIYITGNFTSDHDYTYYQKIYAGSVYGGPTLTAPDPSIKNFYTASESITIDHNFLATSWDGSFFLASIDPNLCNIPESAEGSQTTGNKSANNTNQQGANLLLSNSTIHTGRDDMQNPVLYPNPSDGTFTIRLPREASYTLLVTNLLGEIIYKDNIKNKQLQDVVLPSNTSPGTYTVHITGNDVNFVQKLVITK